MVRKKNLYSLADPLKINLNSLEELLKTNPKSITNDARLMMLDSFLFALGNADLKDDKLAYILRKIRDKQTLKDPVILFTLSKKEDELNIRVEFTSS